MNTAASSYPMASLYVGDLHPDVTEAMLYEKFSPAGPVLSIRVCRDMITRRSLGYAYVNFQQPADDNKALYDTFSAFGISFPAKVVCDENGSKGYAFVHFGTQDARGRAIEKMNGMLLSDAKYLLNSNLENERQSRAKPKEFTNVYIKTLGMIWMMRDSRSSSANMVLLEVCCMPSLLIPVLRQQARPSSVKVMTRPYWESPRVLALISGYQGVNLYIKNLDDTIDDEKLRKEFSPFGSITSAKGDAGRWSKQGLELRTDSTYYAPSNQMTPDEDLITLWQQGENSPQGFLLKVLITIAKSWTTGRLLSHLAPTVHDSNCTTTLQASQPAVHVQGQEPLTASMLAAAPPQEQKQMLGERLFPLIQAMHLSLAGKITGMLLEIDNSELLHMLESPESLRSKVEEAVAVLQAHQAKKEAAQKVGIVAATS
uniref:Uncharacterized protein n=1 Tax=Sphaerodactylus townsendi TaxID=933632 RepID=A0ACB8FQL3_9SAUR